MKLTQLFLTFVQGKLEAQYAMKLEAALGDVTDLRNQLELKSNEVKTSSATIEELRAANAELEVSYTLS